MEETGINIYNPLYKGTIIIENENTIFNLKIFLINEFEGTPKNFYENYSMWMDIEAFLSQNLLYANSIILDRFFYKVLHGDKEFEIKLFIDKYDNILSFVHSRYISLGN